MENILNTLEIHQLTQKQFDEAEKANKLNPNAIYLTPTEVNKYITTSAFNETLNTLQTKISFGTEEPTGGANGDVYIQILD